jgi:hypothetical protein
VGVSKSECRVGKEMHLGRTSKDVDRRRGQNLFGIRSATQRTKLKKESASSSDSGESDTDLEAECSLVVH